MVARFKTLEENLRLLHNLVQSAGGIGSAEGVAMEDVLPAPVSSLQELDDLCRELGDPTAKKKIGKK